MRKLSTAWAANFNKKASRKADFTIIANMHRERKESLWDKRCARVETNQ